MKKPSQRFEAALLDLEGVLTQHRKFQGEVVTLALQSIGINPHFSIAEFYHFRGIGSIHRTRDFLRAIAALTHFKVNVSALSKKKPADVERQILALCTQLPEGVEKKLDAAVAKYRSLRRDPRFFLRKIKLVPGSMEFMRQLKRRNIKVAIVTNANKTLANTLLKSKSLSRFVDEVVTEEETGQEKPSPVPWKYASIKIRAPMARCFVVEDSASGVTSGRRARAGKVFAVLTGTTRRADFKQMRPGPHKIVERAVHVLKYI